MPVEVGCRGGEGGLFEAALSGLLSEFREGRILARSAERRGIERCLGEVCARWDARFTNFPKELFPYASLRGLWMRARRDAYLMDLTLDLIRVRSPGPAVVLNPACGFGSNAIELARRLAGASVVATDIDPRWHNLRAFGRRRHLPENFAFEKDDIFEPRVRVKPAAVVFFGACGSVADGAMDCAIESGAVLLACRTCCHDNIGGNVRLVNRPTGMNLFFRLKNWSYGRLKDRPKFAGYYFSDRYLPATYPRSAAARERSSPEEFLAVAQRSTESDICRAIIDLDRCLYLEERGFDVWYRGELFVAERRPKAPASAP